MAFSRQESMELRKQHNDMYDKYAYFLLAATGTAIGFGLQKLDGLAPSIASFVCVAAVGLWVLSFYLGLKRIETVMMVVRINAELAAFLTPERETQISGNHIAQTEQLASQQMEEFNIKNARLMRAQFYLLIAGAVFFMVWRVMQMFGAGK